MGYCKCVIHSLISIKQKYLHSTRVMVICYIIETQLLWNASLLQLRYADIMFFDNLFNKKNHFFVVKKVSLHSIALLTELDRMVKLADVFVCLHVIICRRYETLPVMSITDLSDRRDYLQAPSYC